MRRSPTPPIRSSQAAARRGMGGVSTSPAGVGEEDALSLSPSPLTLSLSSAFLFLACLVFIDCALPSPENGQKAATLGRTAVCARSSFVPTNLFLYFNQLLNKLLLVDILGTSTSTN